MKQMFAAFLYLCFLVSASKTQHVESSNTVTFRRVCSIQEILCLCPGSSKSHTNPKQNGWGRLEIREYCGMSQNRHGTAWDLRRETAEVWFFREYKKKHSDPISFQQNLGTWALVRLENRIFSVEHYWASRCKRPLHLAFPILPLPSQVVFVVVFVCVFVVCRHKH